MSMGVMRVLSQCGEEEFDKTIHEMPIAGLMETITYFQKEMALEQENFNSLTGELQGIRDRNSRQYKQISKEMMKSQTRLTLLMNRSMKCFAQQNVQHGKPGVELRRRGSLKDQTSITTKPSTPVHRSKSMYIPQSPTDPPPAQATATTARAKLAANCSTNRSSSVVSNGLPTNPASSRNPASTANAVHPSDNVSKSEIKNSTNQDEELRNLPSVKKLLGAFQKPSAMSNGVNSVLPNKVTMRTNVVKKNENRNSFPLTSKDVSGSSSRNGQVNGTAVGVKEQKKKMSTLNINPSVGQQWNARLSGNVETPRPRADSLDTRTASMSPSTPSPFSNVTIISKAKSVTNLVDDSNKDSPSPNRPTNSRTGSSLTINNAGSVTANENGRFISNQKPSGSVFVKAAISEPNRVAGKNVVASNNTNSLKTQNRKSSNKMEASSRLGSKDALLKEIESRRRDEEADSVGEDTFRTWVSLTPGSGERPRSGSAGSAASAGASSLSGSTSDSDSQTNGTTEISVATLVVKADRPAGNQTRPEKPRRMSKPKCAVDCEDIASQQTGTPSATGANIKDVTSRMDDAPVHSVTPTSGAAAGNNVKVMTSRLADTPVQSVTPTSGAAAGNNVKVITSDSGQHVPLEDDDEITPTMNLRPWNPSTVLKELFTVKLMEDTTEDISSQFVSMEGYMEKLPMNKKKATLLKTWKRRFFKATDGWLYYYETSDRNKPSETIQLMGGNIQDLGNRILGIDDGRGRFLMVRCPTDREHGQWRLALDTQTADNTKARYIHPVLKSPPHPQKKVVIIDMGSNAIRAGILGQRPALPQLFFPSVVAVHNTKGNMVVGMDAYFPGVRHESKLHHPISASNKIDKFNIDERQMPAVFSKVFHDLEINPGEYLVMLSTPMDLSDNLRRNLMAVLVDHLQVAGVCMVQQALLSLYSYNTTSGIIVDVGETIEILPIYDGFVIEGGVTMLPYGAEKIEDSLQISLMTENYRFSSRIERLLVKYIMEMSCYVASDFQAALQQCKTNTEKMSHTVDFEAFDLPTGAYPSVTHDVSRFKSPEGLFDMDRWEMDFPNLHKLVFQAIQACPMDSRRHMYRSIYLSGGVTMLPGFRGRLQAELVKLAPPSVPVEVHAAPQRYHAAYVGACSVAGMDVFQQMCISREAWRTQGVLSFTKWKAPKG